MSSDVLGNFSCLDELTQVIYQHADRFVVLSTVSDRWTIHLGLAGPEGRWWRGSWGKTEILQIVVRVQPLCEPCSLYTWLAGCLSQDVQRVTKQSYIHRALNRRTNYLKPSPKNWQRLLSKVNSTLEIGAPRKARISM